MNYTQLSQQVTHACLTASSSDSQRLYPSKPEGQVLVTGSALTVPSIVLTDHS